MREGGDEMSLELILIGFLFFACCFVLVFPRLGFSQVGRDGEFCGLKFTPRTGRLGWDGGMAYDRLRRLDVSFLLSFCFSRFCRPTLEESNRATFRPGSWEKAPSKQQQAALFGV